MVGWYLHFTKERFLFAYTMKKKGQLSPEERSACLYDREIPLLWGYHSDFTVVTAAEGDRCPTKTHIDKEIGGVPLSS